MDFITIIALIVASMLKYSAPLIFTSIGGTFSERGGIVNVGLEGIMVIGAFAGVLFNLTFAESFGNATPWIAAIVAGLVGVLYSLLHAVATINFRADHVVSGTVLNLIAPSLAVFLTRVIYGAGQTPAISHNFKTVSFPILDHIPFLGKVFFTNVSLVAYVCYLGFSSIMVAYLQDTALVCDFVQLVSTHRQRIHLVLTFIVCATMAL